MAYHFYECYGKNKTFNDIPQFTERETPLVTNIPNQHLPVGSVLEFYGRIWTESFAANDSSLKAESHISRIYANFFSCHPTDEHGNS